MAVLLLNATYEPLRIISWQRAIGLWFEDRVDVLESLDERTLRSAGGREFPYPVVVRLRSRVHVPFRRGGVPITRRALVARDNGQCQKAGCRNRGTTIDHLLPRSRGGQHAWDNVALMCTRHNNEKADRTLEEIGWSLKNRPTTPDANALLLGRVSMHPMWATWLPRHVVERVPAA